MSSDFKLTEDLLSMETLSTRTCGEDIFNAVKGACIREKLDLKNLRGICTDGAPAMTGSVRSFVSRFSEYVSTEFNNNLHCIIHQEALCVKSMTLNSTSKCVNGIILFIRSRALNHRQFRELLELSNNSCEDVLYHTAVRWLSQGETSRRVLQLRKEMIEFYSAKQKLCPLNNGDFLTSLALLVDILSHDNTLNRSLQGKEMTVCILFKKVRDFKDKFRLLKHQNSTKKLFSFSSSDRITY